MRSSLVHILYAEDEKSTRQLVKTLFKKVDGVEVAFANDGQEALALYQQNSFDLVATDVYMPNMDGFELIAQIKKIDATQIFVMVTGMEEKEDLIKAITMRVNLFLPKPIDTKEFIKVFNLAKSIASNKKEHTRLQREFEKQHKTFEHLLSKQKSLLCITDFSRTIFASDAFMMFFEIKEPEEFDTNYGSLLELFVSHPEYISAQEKDAFLALYATREENERCVWIQKGENYISFKIDLEMFDDSFYMLTLTDISSLKEVQTQLTNKLEQKLKLIEQQERMMLHQGKLAAMGEMLDAVAHQWKQPLHIIRMRTDFLQIYNEDKQVSQQEIDESMKSILSQVDHMSETLAEFRGFFRPAQNLQIIKLEKLLDSVLLLLKDELIKNQVTLQIKGNLECEIPVLPNEFKHIFINLINNSKDAYNDNKIAPENRKITIFVDDFDDRVLITLQDKAGGIPEYMIEKIFEPNITTKAYGTGTGLYMTKQIINKINGVIKAKNFQEGAIFTIELPKKEKMK